MYSITFIFQGSQDKKCSFWYVGQAVKINHQCKTTDKKMNGVGGAIIICNNSVHTIWGPYSPVWSQTILSLIQPSMREENIGNNTTMTKKGKGTWKLLFKKGKHH